MWQAPFDVRRTRHDDRKLFGTDGVRGTANTYPMTAEMALMLGAAVGPLFPQGHHRRAPRGDRQGHAAVGLHVRKRADRRADLDRHERAAAGPGADPGGRAADPVDAGRSGHHDLGQPQPAADNGIKFFGPDGFKLSDASRPRSRRWSKAAVSPARPEYRPRQADRRRALPLPGAGQVHRAGTDAAGRAQGGVDCANGAAYRRPEVLWELGADVIPLGCRRTATTSTRLRLDHPASGGRAVAAHGADVGICLDGDADRMILIDETGQVADGDQIMALLAARWAERTRLKGRHAGGHRDVQSRAGAVPGRARAAARAHRVGDRYVVEAMRAAAGTLAANSPAIS